MSDYMPSFLAEQGDFDVQGRSFHATRTSPAKFSVRSQAKQLGKPPPIGNSSPGGLSASLAHCKVPVPEGDQFRWSARKQ
jgi:hypothetical protein